MKLRSLDRIDLVVIALPLSTAIAVAGIVFPDVLTDWARIITTIVFASIDWFFLLTVTAFLLLVVWLAFGRYGNIRLGAPSEEPEFSLGSWLAMLFAAGMGVGLLFWGAAEPLIHFAGPPVGEARTPQAAGDAITLTVFSWGLHAWAVYCF